MLPTHTAGGAWLLGPLLPAWLLCEHGCAHLTAIVVIAAAFLTQNIFINEEGQLKLIDNEACLQNNWKNCGFDSILVPTTQKQEIVRMSNQFILKYVPASEAPQGVADPQLLLDYRCYIGEGIGGGREGAD
jgi:hypothetical protein